jgi:hypothetical protein
LPVPELGGVIVIQLTLLVAVHAQPGLVMTLNDPPMRPGDDSPIPESKYEQVVEDVIVNVPEANAVVLVL